MNIVFHTFANKIHFGGEVTSKPVQLLPPWNVALPIFRLFDPQILPNTYPPPQFWNNSYLKKYIFLCQNINVLCWKYTFTRDIYILSHCSCSSVCWMRCKFNQELGGNLLSKTFLLSSQLPLEKAGLQVLRQSQLFPNCFHTIYRILIHFGYICLVASWNGNPLFSAVAELFVSHSLLSLLQPAFCHIFCPCVLTRWRHNDVRMFAAFLFRTGSHCTTVDLNYGSKNGVSGHLVTLRLPS